SVALVGVPQICPLKYGLAQRGSIHAFSGLVCSDLHFSPRPLKHRDRHPSSRRVMAEHQVCAAAEVPEDSVISREVDGQLIAIYNIGGKFYVTEGRCTHGLADLADGILEGEEIECSFHFGKFHVPSGKPTEAPCFIPLKTFKTEVRDGQVIVDLAIP